MIEINYPSAEKVIEYNLLALMTIQAKKSDQAKVLSKAMLESVIRGCIDCKGDIYDKAVVLLKGLVQKHPFASGNRRTAFITTKYFLTSNKKKFAVRNDPIQARVMLGIREKYYTDEEIKSWLKNGKIKEFRR